MINAEWCMKQGIKFKDLTGFTIGLDPQLVSIGYYDKDYKYHECYKGEPFNALVTDCILAWLDMPHAEPPVLNAIEEAYLAALIAPFRDEVKSVEKCRNLATGTEYLYFNVKKGYPFYLKDFKRGTKYKGMETDKEYTLEELGL